jgi:hypothetical protein
VLLPVFFFKKSLFLINIAAKRSFDIRSLRLLVSKLELLAAQPE